MCQVLCTFVGWPIISNNLMLKVVCLFSVLKWMHQCLDDMPFSLIENLYHSSYSLFSEMSKGGELSAMKNFGFSKTACCQGQAKEETCLLLWLPSSCEQFPLSHLAINLKVPNIVCYPMAYLS